MKRKIVILLFFYLLPFIAVWTGWIATAISFDVQSVFKSDMFWGVSMVYWMTVVCVTPKIVEAINETGV
jgi:hypothetical protein